MSNNESIEAKDELVSDSAQNDNKSDDKPTVTAIDLAIEALNHLHQGKRHLLVEDYSSAVISLQESCQLFDQKYGIGAEECGEAYLHYGTALLELARLEDGLFDGVVHTKLAEMSETETEEEEEEDEEEEADDDSQDNEESTDKKSEDKKTDTEEDIEESDEEKKKSIAQEISGDTSKAIESNSASSASALNSSLPTCVASTSSTSAAEPVDENNEDNEASNIEVAWEVLSLAKNVFLRYIEKPLMKQKLAETLQKLGEISIEWENNQNAIEILTESLTLRKEIFPEDDRIIAETYYHLGLAFSFSNDCENANNCFQSAIQVIETRISNQRKNLSSIGPENSDAIESIQREISQLENLLPEMRVKIEDSKDQMDNVRKALEDEKNERMKEDAAALKSQEVKDKPITDISHLIKRKRQNSGPETTPKKMLCSNGHNILNNDNITIDKAPDETQTTTTSTL